MAISKNSGSVARFVVFFILFGIALGVFIFGYTGKWAWVPGIFALAFLAALVWEGLKLWGSGGD